MVDIEERREVQATAKAVLADLGPSIRPIDTEQSIAVRALRLLQRPWGFKREDVYYFGPESGVREL